MFDLVTKFLGKRTASPSGDEKTEDVQDRMVATCALLLELAHIDGEFSDAERDAIVSILIRDYSLSEEAATQLLRASKAELERSIDLWHFTNVINQNYSMEEKISIIEMVWKVVYTDGVLDQHEDYLVHKLANLLHLNHKQLIDAKLKIVRGG
ncbi:MAG: TerB family tellurite resistance protein [Deltaproteobacteria bacterium]|nr:TerB family tellurite resistance protein [Deltaproteobacteria bacterium]